MRCVVVCLLSLLPLWAGADEFRVSYQLEQFLWQEYDDSGDLFLDENGLRHLFSLTATSRFEPQVVSDFDAHVIVGTVNSEGWNQDYKGNLLGRMERDTEYRGYGLEAGFTYFTGGAIAAQLSGGGVRMALGLDQWTRGMRGTGGHDEEFLVTYGRLAGVYLVPEQWRVEYGAKLPIAASQELDLSAYGFAETVHLHLMPQPSLYLIAEYHIGHGILLFARYDGYSFGKSDTEMYANADGNDYGVSQYRSEMQTLSMGLSFPL